MAVENGSRANKISIRNENADIRAFVADANAQYQPNVQVFNNRKSEDAADDSRQGVREPRSISNQQVDASMGARKRSAEIRQHNQARKNRLSVASNDRKLLKRIRTSKRKVEGGQGQTRGDLFYSDSAGSGGGSAGRHRIYNTVGRPNEPESALLPPHEYELTEHENEEGNLPKTQKIINIAVNNGKQEKPGRLAQISQLAFKRGQDLGRINTDKSALGMDFDKFMLQNAEFDLGPNPPTGSSRNKQ